MAQKGLHKYTVQEAQNATMGQAGAIFYDGTGTAIEPSSGQVFVAIQFITDTNFDASNGLIGEDDNMWPSVTGTSSSVLSAGAGTAIDAVIFPAGMTIYGRWNKILLDSGSIIAYIG